MCRFAAYIGEPIPLNDLVSRSHDSLIKQSSAAQETDITLNADGFGIGWYNPSAHVEPSVYVNILPAWNDINLRSISKNIISPCFFGHVRAAMEGQVSLHNCHPFAYRQYLFMHNGGIAGFKKIKLALYERCADWAFAAIKGQTDSETLFALWLTHYLPTEQTTTDMLTAWRQSLEIVADLQLKQHITAATHINAVVTDGRKLVALRYSSDPNYYLTLHYAAGRQFVRGVAP